MPNPLSTVRRRFKSWKQRYTQPWRIASYGGIRVHYKDCLDGGGTSFGQEFIPFFQRRAIPKQTRVFEWCAGPAFIGFSMLGHGLCETLCLADVNATAVAACRRTIADNRLNGRVSVYRSNNLSAIPAGEQWDVIVGNPPHFDNPITHLRDHDRDWRVHRQFFGAVGQFLRKGGVIILQENNTGSTAETFHEMVEAAGLAIIFVDGGKPYLTQERSFYYIGIARRGDPVPDWANDAAIG